LGAAANGADRRAAGEDEVGGETGGGFCSTAGHEEKRRGGGQEAKEDRVVDELGAGPEQGPAGEQEELLEGARWVGEGKRKRGPVGGGKSQVADTSNGDRQTGEFGCILDDLMEASVGGWSGSAHCGEKRESAVEG
jgi:hypothetical protein